MPRIAFVPRLPTSMVLFFRALRIQGLGSCVGRGLPPASYLPSTLLLLPLWPRLLLLVLGAFQFDLELKLCVEMTHLLY